MPFDESNSVLNVYSFANNICSKILQYLFSTWLSSRWRY